MKKKEHADFIWIISVLNKNNILLKLKWRNYRLSNTKHKRKTCQANCVINRKYQLYFFQSESGPDMNYECCKTFFPEGERNSFSEMLLQRDSKPQRGVTNPHLCTLAASNKKPSHSPTTGRKQASDFASETKKRQSCFQSPRHEQT